MSSPYTPIDINYHQFSAPYAPGWEDGEDGNTPITAYILNNTYDQYLTWLNFTFDKVSLNFTELQTSLADVVTDANYVHTDNNFTSELETKLQSLNAVYGNPILPVGPTIEFIELETMQIGSNYYKITHSGGGGSNPTDGTFYKRTNIYYRIFVVYDSHAISEYYATIDKYDGDTCIDTDTLRYEDISGTTGSITVGDITLTYDSESEYDNKTSVKLNSYKIIEHGNNQYTSYYEEFAAVNNDYLYVVNEFHASEVEANYDLFVGNGISYTITVNAFNPMGMSSMRVVKYGGKSIIADGTFPIASGSYGDLGNIRYTCTGTTVTLISDMDYVKYGNVLAGTNDTICELTPPDESDITASFIEEGSLGQTAGSLNNIRIDDKVYTVSGGSGSSTLSGLSDVTITSPSNGQILSYDSSTSKWVNSSNSPYTDVTGTLTAGSTSITLSDNSITSSSTIEVFDDLDIPYNSKTLSTGSITLIFDAQQSDMSVKVRVS